MYPSCHLSSSFRISLKMGLLQIQRSNSKSFSFFLSQNKGQFKGTKMKRVQTHIIHTYKHIQIPAAWQFVLRNEACFSLLFYWPIAIHNRITCSALSMRQLTYFAEYITRHYGFPEHCQLIDWFQIEWVGSLRISIFRDHFSASYLRGARISFINFNVDFNPNF